MRIFERTYSRSAAFLKKKGFGQSPVGIILGTGMSAVAGAIVVNARADMGAVPGLPRSSVKFQRPFFMQGRIGQTDVICTDGRYHFYEGHSLRDVCSIVYVMHMFGVKRLFITSAVGGINKAFKVGDIVLVKDHINLSGLNPAAGLRDGDGHAVFPDMIDAYDEAGRKDFLSAARSEGVAMKEGVLAYLPGPSFETRAELKFIEKAGADLIGWSMVPEVIFARALGMSVTGICCVSDISNPKSVTHADLDDIVSVCERSAAGLTRVMKRAVAARLK